MVLRFATRALRSVRRRVMKAVRLVRARRNGLAYIRPDFIYRPRLSRDSVVIDGGCSYLADFSVALIERHGVRAFGVDPTRKHRPALEALERAHPGRFVHLPCAIAAADGRLTFHESRVNESGSLMADHVNVLHDETVSYDVEALSLDGLLRRIGADSADMLKIDLEGAEYELLDGIPCDAMRRFRQIFVEFHHHAVSHWNEGHTRTMVRKICDCGFSAFSLDDHNYLFERLD